jgi:ferrous iron transport protein B
MIHVALAGNPNTGKTTLFNRLTGARAHVGNYPGITVERRQGQHQPGTGEAWTVHDLPGCYSLAAHSPDEQIAHHALTGRLADVQADVVVVVLDATNLARNLFLLLQIAELGRPLLGALNMMDAARSEGLAIDVDGLAAALGCPLVPMVAHTGEGVADLEAAVQAVAREPGRSAVIDTRWPPAVQDAIAQARPVVASVQSAPRDGEVLWWLGSDPELVDTLQPGLGARLVAVVPRALDPSADVRRLATEARYARIDALLQTHVTRPLPRPSVSERIDRIVLHPALGGVLFLAVMTLLFQAVFLGAEPLMNAIDGAMAALGGWLRPRIPGELLSAVLVDGLLAGVAATVVFLPQILILFAGITLLEDFGYLARTAYLIDRLMARIGLPGKAFVPMLSSFACAVPGIMATRTMADRRDRLRTILILPLMSCSARLPVYTLVTASVFAGAAPVAGLLSVGALAIAAMYVFGFAVALAAAWVLRRTAVPGGGAPLVLEMPPWRWPRPRNVARVLWDRGRQFVVETGTVIVALSVVLWALLSFPRDGLPATELAHRQAAIAQLSAAEQEPARRELEAADARRQIEHSVAGRLGKLVEPVLQPLGLDWRIGIGLVGSFAAREVLVPTLSQVYGHGKDADPDESAGLVAGALRQGGLTPLKGLSLMVFFAIALQCLSTVAAIRREAGGWRWAGLALAYLNGLAWLSSLAVYQIGRVLGYA